MVGGIKGFKQQRAVDRESRGGDRGKFIPELDFKSAKVAIFQLVGPADEPYVYNGHRVTEYREGRQFPDYKVRVCATGHPGFPGCVYCYQHDGGDKKINRPSQRAAWQVADCRWFHRAPLVKDGTVIQKRDKSGPVLVDVVCRGASCVLCKSKNEEYAKKVRGGLRRLDLSSMYAETFVAEIDAISQFCVRCWHVGDEGPDGGTVERVKMVCPECGVVVPLSKYDPDDPDSGTFKCLGCGKVIEPEEVVKCANKCKNARRVNAWDGKWKDTKSGEGKNTNHGFQFLGVKPREDWMDEIELADLATYYKPLSCEATAKFLRVPNPFAGGSTSMSSEAPHNSPDITSGSEEYEQDEGGGEQDEDNIPF